MYSRESCKKHRLLPQSFRNRVVPLRVFLAKLYRPRVRVRLSYRNIPRICEGACDTAVQSVHQKSACKATSRNSLHVEFHEIPGRVSAIQHFLRWYIAWAPGVVRWLSLPVGVYSELNTNHHEFVFMCACVCVRMTEHQDRQNWGTTNAYISRVTTLIIKIMNEICQPFVSKRIRGWKLCKLGGMLETKTLEQMGQISVFHYVRCYQKCLFWF